MILTVTGASTRCTFPSSTNISLARKHNALTSFSRRYSHRFSRSIWESSEVTEPPPPFDEVVVWLLAGVAGEALAGDDAARDIFFNLMIFLCRRWNCG